MPYTLVEKVRGMVRDRPLRSRVTNSGGINAAAISMTVPAAHIGNFQVGQRVEWDDDTDETAEVTDVTPDTNTVTFGAYGRGIESSTAAIHAENSIVLINPRFRYVEIADAAQDIVEGELWPHVYKYGETTLSYEADGHYAPSATDIEEITLAYQLDGGRRYDLWHEWVGPEEAGTGYTNGMVRIPAPYNSSTIYVAYKARISLATATDRQLRLIATGTAAQLLLMEEAVALAPDRPASVGRIQEGSRLRAGQILWDRFINQRNTERVNLLEDELVTGQGVVVL